MKSTPRLTSDMVAEVMIQGRAIKSGSFLFKFLKEAENKPFKTAVFGFIASKKNFPTAVARNKARRIGRAALRSTLYTADLISSPLIPSLGAFVFSKEVLTVRVEDLSREIEQVLIKSGILLKP